MENAPTVDYTLEIRRSPPGSTFSGTVLATLTIAAGTHEVVQTSSFGGGGTVDSGDLVAIFYTVIGQVGSGDSISTITLEGQAT